MIRGSYTAVLALTVALVAATPADGTATLPPARDPAALTLRLPDLGPGYIVSDETDAGTHCVPYRLSGLPGRPAHRGCDIGFTRAWHAPGAPSGPDDVESDAYVFDDAPALVSAFARPRALAAAVFGAPQRLFRPITLDPPPLVGDATVVLRGDTGVAIAMWRSQSVLGVVLIGGRGAQASPTVALRLAAAQQARIATPTPLLRSDLDDTEVWLDDPNLGVPVWWLGRHRAAQNGRPALGLLDGPPLMTGRFQPRLDLNYTSPGGRAGVDVALWKPRTLRRALRQDAKRAMCIRRYDGRLPGAKATIYGSYKPPRRHCEPGPPEVLFAVAFLHRVAVTLDASDCFGCRAGRAPYDSLAGLRVLLRALRVREPRSATPAP